MLQNAFIDVDVFLVTEKSYYYFLNNVDVGIKNIVLVLIVVYVYVFQVLSQPIWSR